MARGCASCAPSRGGILDLQYPTKCEDPDPGLDAEYGRSCGAQAGMDWGFAWVRAGRRRGSENRST